MYSFHAKQTRTCEAEMHRGACFAWCAASVLTFSDGQLQEVRALVSSLELAALLVELVHLKVATPQFGQTLETHVGGRVEVIAGVEVAERGMG